MPILSSVQTPLQKLIEDVTSGTDSELNWNKVMQLVDYLNEDPLSPKECVKSLIKQLSNKNPRIVLSTIAVLDACVNNCGKRFHLELSCREFENEIRKILSRQPQTLPHQVLDALFIFIKKWGESKEFTEDSQLSLIPSIYRQLKKDGVRFPDPEANKPKSQALPTDPNVVSSAQEEEDIAKAIELSLRDSGGSSVGAAPSNNSHDSRNRSTSSGSMYPTFDLSQPINSSSINGSSHVPTSGSKKSPTSYQVRAMYDFEAAEDNELTFKAGEIIVVLDDSDTNWWKGSNHRGEGLFPANFVTNDLNYGDEDEDSNGKKNSGRSKSGKSVQFKEEVSVRKVDKDEAVTQVNIDVEKIDKLLHLLHEADPTDEKPDSDELVTLEEQCCLMAPLIDEELKKVDRRLASLDSLSSKLVEAMSMYYSLMQNAPASDMAPAAAWNGNIASNVPAYGQMHPVMPWNQQQPPQPQHQQQQQPQPQQSTYSVQPPVASTTVTNTWNQVPVAADGTYIAPTSSTGNTIYEHHPYYGQINTVAQMPNYGEATGLNTQVATSLPPSNPILSHPNQLANPANLQN